MVRDYLIENPELLIEMSALLERKQAKEQQESRNEPAEVKWPSLLAGEGRCYHVRRPISGDFLLRAFNLAVAAVLIILAGLATAKGGGLEQRVEAVGKTVDEADDMFRAAMKGHFPSVQAINAARARMVLAKALYRDAKAEASAGKANQAEAKLDAAEFLARQVYEAADH